MSLILIRPVFSGSRYRPRDSNEAGRNRRSGIPGYFQREQLEALNDPEVTDLCQKVAVTSWLGPDKHSIFYPVRGGDEFNLVLLRPDNLEKGTRRVQGDVEEMRESYSGWDETLVSSRVSIPILTRLG